MVELSSTTLTPQPKAPTCQWLTSRLVRDVGRILFQPRVVSVCMSTSRAGFTADDVVRHNPSDVSGAYVTNADVRVDLRKESVAFPV